MQMTIRNWFKVGVAVMALATADARAFTLLGPFTSWQVTGLGYAFGDDIGGPMNLREGFRWNVPVIVYSYDKSFIDYFGPDGIKAIDQAIQYFNDLPPANKLSDDLSEFSTSTVRENHEATMLGLIDLKSAAMTVIMEELGFADPIRYTFTLRARTVETIGNVQFTNYTTILRNFDPVTLQPSRFVNGTLYTYEIREFRAPDHADALEVVRFGDPDLTVPVATGLGRATLFPTLPPNTGPSVSGAAGSFPAGIFRVGLTRDDVGGIRFLYHPNNFAVETLLPTVTAGFGLGGKNAWVPFTGVTNQTTVTNVVIGGSNSVVSAGLRGGRNKLKFQRVFFDALVGSTFRPITNEYTDVLVSTNATLIVQPVQRGITQPDILFVAEDLGLVDNLIPAVIRRSDTSTWIDNDAINGNDETALSHGPGVITPTVRISFTDQLPFFGNTTGSSFLDFPTEDDSFYSGVWGSFDGSTNAPVIYPVYQNISLKQLRREILNRKGQ